jgi:hypothetical protein
MRGEADEEAYVAITGSTTDDYTVTVAGQAYATALIKDNEWRFVPFTSTEPPYAIPVDDNVDDGVDLVDDRWEGGGDWQLAVTAADMATFTFTMTSIYTHRDLVDSEVSTSVETANAHATYVYSLEPESGTVSTVTEGIVTTKAKDGAATAAGVVITTPADGSATLKTFQVRFDYGIAHNGTYTTQFTVPAVTPLTFTTATDYGQSLENQVIRTLLIKKGNG